MRLLLLSNSTNHGCGFLEHARSAIKDVLGDVDRLLFVPLASSRHREYTERVRGALAPCGIAVEELECGAAERQLSAAQAVFVGGGNTFRLLRSLQQLGATALLAERVREGLIYVGASAGTNVACPTLRTTNDMPIVSPVTFEALALLPFQINPHYVDRDPTSVVMSEPRELRIEEFLEENDVPVLGLREGSWLRVDTRLLRIGGSSGARLFQRGVEPREIESGADVSFLLRARYRYDVGRDE